MSINFVEIMLLGKVTNIGIFNCFIIRVSNFMKIRPPSHFLGLARILQLQCIKPGGGGVFPKVLGGGVPHGCQNPDPISDQNV